MTKGEFLDLFAEMLEVPKGSFTGSESLSEDVENWDSLAVVSFLALADEHFGVTVSPKKVAECKTVDDLIALLGGSVTN